MSRSILVLLAAPLLVGLTWYFIAAPYLKRSSIAFERSYRIAEPLERVRNGEDYIDIYDTELLHLLAVDDSCIRNLTGICFNAVELDASDGAVLDKLVNVTEVGFYSCRSIEPVVEVIAGMDVNHIWFETSEISPESIRILGGGPRIKTIDFDCVLSAEQVDAVKSLPGAIRVNNYD